LDQLEALRTIEKCKILVVKLNEEYLNSAYSIAQLEYAKSLNRKIFFIKSKSIDVPSFIYEGCKHHIIVEVENFENHKEMKRVADKFAEWMIKVLYEKDNVNFTVGIKNEM